MTERISNNQMIVTSTTQKQKTERRKSRKFRPRQLAGLKTGGGNNCLQAVIDLQTPKIATNIGDISGISPIKPNKLSPRRKVLQGGRKETKKLDAERKLRAQVSGLESRIRRLETENGAATLKINTLNSQIKEKDRHIHDLELRLPRVLADISRGLGAKEVRKTTFNRGFQDSMRRNHFLNLKIKELERNESEHLLAEEIWKEEREKLKSDLKTKEKTLKEASEARNLSEEKLLTTLGEKADISNLCHRLTEQNSVLQEGLQAKDRASPAFINLQQENEFLYGEINTHYDELLRTEEELNQLESIVLSIIRSQQTEAEKVAEPFSPWNFEQQISFCPNLTWPAGDVSLREDSSFLHPVSSEDDLDDEGEIFGNSALEADTSHGSSDEFETSQDRSAFLSRVEELDFKLELLVSRLDRTITSRT